MIYLTDKLAVTADSECYMVGRPVETVQESGGKRCKAPKLRSPNITPQWPKRCAALFLPPCARRWRPVKSPACKSLSGRSKPCRRNLLRNWRC